MVTWLAMPCLITTLQSELENVHSPDMMEFTAYSLLPEFMTLTLLPMMLI